MVVCLRCLLHQILSLIAYKFRENRELFSLLLCRLWWVQIFGYVLASRSHSFVCTVHASHYHHCANLSEGIELINAGQIYFVEYVSKIKNIVSVIHYTICGAVCFQFIHFSCDDWENIHTLSHYHHHHQIGRMNYYPLFMVRSWNNGVRCMSFYILLSQNRLLHWIRTGNFSQRHLSRFLIFISILQILRSDILCQDGSVNIIVILVRKFVKGKSNITDENFVNTTGCYTFLRIIKLLYGSIMFSKTLREIWKSYKGLYVEKLLLL